MLDQTKIFIQRFKIRNLRPSSSVLGKSRMGTNSELATGSILIDHNVEKNTIYFGNPKENFIKKKIILMKYGKNETFRKQKNICLWRIWLNRKINYKTFYQIMQM